jgi:hypothetical protein
VYGVWLTSASQAYISLQLQFITVIRVVSNKGFFKQRMPKCFDAYGDSPG